jgi:hypothetical protein
MLRLGPSAPPIFLIPGAFWQGGGQKFDANVYRCAAWYIAPLWAPRWKSARAHGHPCVRAHDK